jgi:hypothetical protein
VGLPGAVPGIGGADDDDAGEGRRTSRHSDCPPEPACPVREDPDGADGAVDGGVKDEDDVGDELAGADDEDGAAELDVAGSAVSLDEDGVNEGLRSAGVKTEAAGLAVLTGGAMIEL